MMLYFFTMFPASETFVPSTEASSSEHQTSASFSSSPAADQVSHCKIICISIILVCFVSAVALILTVSNLTKFSSTTALPAFLLNLSSTDNATIPPLKYNWLLKNVVKVAGPVLGIIFKYSAAARRWVMFSFEHAKVYGPTTYGFVCGEQLYLNHSDGGHVGVWIIPAVKDCLVQNGSVDIANGRMVVLLVHGRDANRTSPTRLLLYRMLTTEVGYHVIAFDYRGCADSSPIKVTVDSLVNDTQFVYHWILSNNIPREHLIIWAHSLGTGVTVHAVAHLPPKQAPLFIVLEASITSAVEAIRAIEVNLLKYNKFITLYDKFVNQTVKKIGDVNIDSVEWVAQVHCPILFLHSKDDSTLPYRLGRKLYKVARAKQPTEIAAKTHFVTFPGNGEYGHNNIVLHEKLPKIVLDYTKYIQSSNSSTPGAKGQLVLVSLILVATFIWFEL